MKQKRPSFVARTKSSAREAAGLGALLVNKPREFPGAILKIFQRAFRKVWETRGGGFYASGFFVAFVWFEVTSFFTEIFTASSVSGLFGAQLMGLVFRFTVESLQNTLFALLWPAFIVQVTPPWGILALLIMYLVFAAFIKSPLERWLFGDDTVREQAAAQQSAAGDRHRDQENDS